MSPAEQTRLNRSLGQLNRRQTWGNEYQVRVRWTWGQHPRTIRTAPTPKQLCATRETVKAEIESMRSLLNLQPKELLS